MSKKNKKNDVRVIFLISFIIVSLGLAYWYLRASSNNTNTITYFYDFENDEIGLFPSGSWRGTRWDGTEIIKWRNENEGFGKVAEIMNRDGDGVEFAIRFTDSKKGVIEFDIYGDVSKEFTVHICQEDAVYNPIDDIIIRLGTEIKVTDVGVYRRLGSFTTDTWLHLKIEYDVDSDWHLWIDDVSLDNNQGFGYINQPSYMSQIYFYTFESSNRFYVDNVEITVKE